MRTYRVSLVKLKVPEADLFILDLYHATGVTLFVTLAHDGDSRFVSDRVCLLFHSLGKGRYFIRAISIVF